jgi:hypothetical protein
VLRTASFKRKSLIASPFAPSTLPLLRSFDVPATVSLKIPATLTTVVERRCNADVLFEA